jgi:hypothetical protein
VGGECKNSPTGSIKVFFGPDLENIEQIDTKEIIYAL